MATHTGAKPLGNLDELVRVFERIAIRFGVNVLPLHVSIFIGKRHYNISTQQEAMQPTNYRTFIKLHDVTLPQSFLLFNSAT